MVAAVVVEVPDVVRWVVLVAEVVAATVAVVEACTAFKVP
jgi:hypothetical protein